MKGWTQQVMILLRSSEYKETQHTKGTTMLIRQAVQHAATDNECQKIPSYKHDHVYNHSQKCFFV